MKFKNYLTKSKFKHWLKKHGEHGNVGTPRAPSACPLANFLRENYYTVLVYITEVSLGKRKNSKLKTKPLPKWAKKFVSKIDASDRDWVSAGIARKFVK